MVNGSLRSLFFFLILTSIVACSGGGCSNGCGTTPLAGGFPKADTIPNAATLRLTRPGLDFIGKEAPAFATRLLESQAGTLSFEIPASTQAGPVGTTVQICPTGASRTSNPPRCIAEINLAAAKLRVDALTPSSLAVTGTLPVRLRDLFGSVSVVGDFHVGAGTGSCRGGIPEMDYRAVPVHIEIPVIAETIAPRDGYTKLDVDAATIDLGVTRNDIVICKDCGIVTGICNTVLDWVEGFVFETLVSGVKAQLRTALAEFVCTKPTVGVDPPCPTGSHPNQSDLAAATCVYDSRESTCVPLALGTEAHVDLGSFLRDLSPSARGGLDFALFAGGTMNPAPRKPPNAQGETPNGATLSMLGGTIPRPPSQCVPQAPNPPPQGLPVPDELLGDTVAGWPSELPGPHVGIGLAERFLKHALTSVYNSGLLCLDVTTEQFPQLNTGLVSAIIPSLKNLTSEQKAAAMAVATRPQTAPVITFGGGTDLKSDPLVRLGLTRLALDFYTWTDDRFVRAFTFTADVSLPISLETGKSPSNPTGGLVPLLGEVTVTNPSVENADLLAEEPSRVQGSLSAILTAVLGQVIGRGLPVIDISAPLAGLGLGLTIPKGGVKRLRKGDDNFLAIFANLESVPVASRVLTRAEARLEGREVHPEAMTLAGFDRAKLPVLHLAFDRPGEAEAEFSWSIDQGTRSGWARGTESAISNETLFLQGRHVLHVWSRRAGDPSSEDVEPRDVPFTIDTLAPRIELVEQARHIDVRASDYVSAPEALQARVQFQGPEGEFGAWSEWAPLGAVPVEGELVVVEVRDEEGNVGRVAQALRGRADPTLNPSGCSGCRAAGTSGTPGIVASIFGALLLVAFALRRGGGRRWVAPLGIAGLATLTASTQGCDCGDSDGAPAGTKCGLDCNSACEPGLDIGVVGSYTSVARAPDGTLWVAGYNDASLSNDGSYVYGDLVVGPYDSGRQAVLWRTVDGTPPLTAGTCPTADPAGWRGGLVDSGNDVGLWTSLAFEASGRPIVSYFDASNDALKFAAYDGATWQVHTVAQRERADIGRYAKMLVVDGIPLIAHLVIEAKENGRTRSKVVLARAKSATPRDATAWSFEDVLVNEDGPCRASSCPGSQLCMDTGDCAPTASGCSPACGLGSSCATIEGGPRCVTTAGDFEAYPPAVGDYIALAQGPKGLAIVTYDRLHGNLLGLAPVGGNWRSMLLDGETGSRKEGTARDTGDTGIGASLAIDEDGDWHVTYVDGTSEGLRYLRVAGGTTPSPSEMVDDGTAVDDRPFVDGRHLVGDDSQVTFVNGVVTVIYQDATAGTLRLATGVPGSSGRKWTRTLIPQPGRFGGFFPRFVPGDRKIANFWRSTDRATAAMRGNVAIVDFPVTP